MRLRSGQDQEGGAADVSARMLEGLLIFIFNNNILKLLPGFFKDIKLLNKKFCLPVYSMCLCHSSRI